MIITYIIFNFILNFLIKFSLMNQFYFVAIHINIIILISWLTETWSSFSNWNSECRFIARSTIFGTSWFTRNTAKVTRITEFNTRIIISINTNTRTSQSVRELRRYTSTIQNSIFICIAGITSLKSWLNTCITTIIATF